MKSTALFLGVVLYGAQLMAMNPTSSEEESLLPHHSSNRISLQNTPGTSSSNLRASKPLREMLAHRSPQFEPLLDQSVREKNMKFFESMGSQKAYSKIFWGLGIIAGLNLAKQGTALALWGFHKNNDFLNLIPINHLMNLLPACVQVCWETCDPQGCNVICSTSGYCPDLLQINGITYPSVLVGLVNLGLVGGAATKLITNHWERKASQKTLSELLLQLDERTAQESEEPITDTAVLALSLPNMLDQQIARAAANTDEIILEDERKNTISLIQHIGEFKTSTKLCALLALVCAANLVNDTIIASLWGLDTKYPALPTNNSNQTHCRSVMVPTGCCTELCGGWDCFGVNTTVCDNDQTSVPNKIGVTHTVGVIANFLGGLASLYMANSSHKKVKIHEEKMKKILKNLDELIDFEKCDTIVNMDEN